MWRCLRLLAVFTAIGCPVVILVHFNKDVPLFTAHHHNAEPVYVWALPPSDPSREWLSEGRLLCTWRNGTGPACPEVGGKADAGLHAANLMRMAVRNLYPASLLGRLLAPATTYLRGREDWRVTFQAALLLQVLVSVPGWLACIVVAYAYEKASLPLEGGGWTVLVNVPAAVMLAVRMELATNLVVGMHAWARYPLALLFLFGTAVSMALTAAAYGHAWWALGAVPLHYALVLVVGVHHEVSTAFTQQRTLSRAACRAYSMALLLVVCEFAVWTLCYFYAYATELSSYLMPTNTHHTAAVCVLAPILVPALLCYSALLPHDRITTCRAYFDQDPAQAWAEPDDASDMSSEYSFCSEEEGEGADPSECGAVLHLRLPDGRVVPVEVTYDATLWQLRRRAQQACGGHVGVRLSVGGQALQGSRHTPLSELPLEAGDTVDVRLWAASQAAVLEAGITDRASAQTVMLHAMVSDDRRAACLALRSGYDADWAWFVSCQPIATPTAAAALRHLMLRATLRDAERIIHKHLPSRKARGCFRRWYVLDRRPQLLSTMMPKVSPWAQYCLQQCTDTPLHVDHVSAVYEFAFDFIHAADSTDGDFVDPSDLLSALQAQAWEVTDEVRQHNDAGLWRHRLWVPWSQVGDCYLSLVRVADGDFGHVILPLLVVCGYMAVYTAAAVFLIYLHATRGTQGVDAESEWLFVVFLIPASICIGYELLPEWIRWYIVHRLRRWWWARAERRQQQQDEKHGSQGDDVEMHELPQLSESLLHDTLT